MLATETQQVSLVHPQDPSLPLEVQDNRLVCNATGESFPIINGIPRLVGGIDEQQEQTQEGFGYKWQRTPKFGAEPGHLAMTLQAYREWFGIEKPEDFAVHMKGKTLLNAGCGCGRNEHVWGHLPARVVDLDISAAIDVARGNWGHDPRYQFVQADVHHIPFADGTFDVVWSEGVLHHTPNTKAGLNSCVRVLKEGGRILFYVYRQKAPLREFADDHIRRLVADMSPADAWQALEPLTKMAQAFANLKVNVTIPEDVELLGFKAGTYDVQRFMYYNVMKFFWNDGLSFDENVHLNFDWYYPKYCWRHTADEVRGWLKEFGLREVKLFEADSGLGVIADKIKR